ncbi:hypothetical protein [Hymenobacter psoromatis]|uniref:hypothetical protein n=1 Tax=Hymenobacter psoromatis TaxID=1484116 RepID=UPI001CC0D56D|nr:hypothetical protein [Hymenobacter psoromatis]
MLFFSKALYESNKKFILYDYLVSHGQLLLRADKINEKKGFNTDIVFFDTAYVQLPAFFMNGVSITQDNGKKRFGYPGIDNGLDNEYRKCFEIVGDSASYYVVASFFQVFENDLAFDQTSLGFLDPEGIGKEIARSF